MSHLHVEVNSAFTLHSFSIPQPRQNVSLVLDVTY